MYHISQVGSAQNKKQRAQNPGLGSPNLAARVDDGYFSIDSYENCLQIKTDCVENRPTFRQGSLMEEPQ